MPKLLDLPAEIRSYIFSFVAPVLRLKCPVDRDFGRYPLPTSSPYHNSNLALLLTSKRLSYEFRTTILRSTIFFLVLGSKEPLSSGSDSTRPWPQEQHFARALQDIVHLDLALLWSECHTYSDDEVALQQLRNITRKMLRLQLAVLRVYHACYDAHWDDENGFTEVRPPEPIDNRTTAAPKLCESRAQAFADILRNSLPDLRHFSLTYGVVQDSLDASWQNHHELVPVVDADPHETGFPPDVTLVERRSRGRWVSCQNIPWGMTRPCKRCRTGLSFSLQCLDYCGHSKVK